MISMTKPAAFCLVVFTICNFASADFLVSLRNAYFDGGVNRIVRLSETGDVLGDFIPPTEVSVGGLSGPTGLHFADSGSLLVTSTFGNELLEYDAQTGAFLGTLAPNATNPPSPPLDGPTALRQMPNGQLLVANLGAALTGFLGESVTIIDPANGDATGNFGSGHLGATGILIAGEDVYVSQITSNQVLRFDLAGILQETISDALIAGPTGLAIDPNTGNLLIASVNGDMIVQYDGSSVSSYLSTPSQFFPSGVYFTDDQTFLVTSSAVGSILKYTVGDPIPTPFVGFEDFGLGPADLLNGVAIGDVLRIFASCDFDRDGVCGLTDIDALVAAIAGGDNDSAFDLTGDGQVDLADRDAWLAAAGAENLPGGSAYLVGDANLDGFVDVTDFNLWNAAKFQATGAWSLADFNADGTSDVSDFNSWNANKFQSSLGVVPEPSSGLVGWFLLHLSCLYLRRRG